MKGKKIFAVMLSALMVFSVFAVAELAVGSPSVVAYAASAKVKKVSSVKVSSACDKIKISYKKVKGASGYEIRYSTKKNGKYKKLAATKKTSYSGNAKSSKKLYYKVRAYKTVKGKKIYGAYSDVKSVKKKGHSYGAYYVQKKATCSAKGRKYQVCSKCKKKRYADISIDKIDGHSYVTIPSTCTAEGKRYCQHCGKVTSTSKPLGHSFTAYVSDKNATCVADGTQTAKCDRCGALDTRTEAGTKIAHNYSGAAVSNGNRTHNVYCVNGCNGFVSENCSFTVTVVTPQTATSEGLRRFTCKKCAFSYDEIIPACTQHNYVETVVPATCTAPGYTLHTCSYCGDSYMDNETPIAAHTKGDYVTDANGYRVYNCRDCGAYMETDYTCYIDLTARTISVPAVASFGLSTTGRDKLDLNTDGVSDFEITGTAVNLTIDVNAATNCDVKLAGVTITNTGTVDNGFNCISVKNKSPMTETGQVSPDVSITAKNGTVNTLTVHVKGKAIESECKTTRTSAEPAESACKLELKGQGTLNLDTSDTQPNDKGNGSSAVSCFEKIEIKNLTLNINSNNRGIDTERTDTVNGLPDDEYYNIEFGANAKVTIHSKNDCIRCKNMDFNLLGEGETDSVVNLFTASGDALQLEGKATNRGASLIMHSGILSLNGGNFNNKSNTAPVIDGSAKLNLF